jgi:hypothetical protein
LVELAETMGLDIFNVVLENADFAMGYRPGDTIQGHVNVVNNDKMKCRGLYKRK